ncbi:MAG: hypothetical protein H0U42_11685 [Thermoleophilaceae bacterium]|nr:hypothetical protein [Thermoleophilaceae bacterium]
MRAARIVLLFFLVLFTSAGVAALVNPLPRPPTAGTRTATSTVQSRSTTTKLPEASAGTTEESVRPGPPGVEQIELEVPEGASEGEPKPTPLESERRVIVTVSSPEPGEVTLEGLGRVEPVDARTPAVFDLLTDRTGEFEVRFDPAGEGGPRGVGTLVVSD